MKWMPTCKETTELASRAMDERLQFTDRIAMKFHLALCKNCARFNTQLHDMRRLFRVETGAEGAPGLTTEARQRIESELHKKLDT